MSASALKIIYTVSYALSIYFRHFVSNLILASDKSIRNELMLSVKEMLSVYNIGLFPRESRLQLSGKECKSVVLPSLPH